MSLFSLISKGISLFSKAKKIKRSIKGIRGAKTIKTAAVPAIVGAGGALVARTLPKIGGALRGQLPGIAAGVATGVLFDQFGNPVPGTGKRRRMNPCNAKALTRALRRVESFHRVQKRVEKSMRRACPPRSRRTTPSRCK